MSIRDELLAIKGNRELLTAKEVVEWAQSHPDSELHRSPEFHGWDVNKAAWEHWLLGARRLIAINIVFEDGERKFVSLSIDRHRDGGGYRDVDDVLKNQTLFEVMLADALKELERVQKRYQHLDALKPVWVEAEKIRTRAETKAKRTSKPPPRGRRSVPERVVA